MALTRDNVGLLRSEIDMIERAYNTIVEKNDSYKWVMKQQDFIDFANGTNFGASAQEKMNTLTSIIDGQLNEQIVNLIANTRHYCDNYEAIINSEMAGK